MFDLRCFDDIFTSNSLFFSVDDAEIARLGRRFNRLDANGNGSLSRDELMQIPELARNPLLHRFIDVFDANKNGEVDFKGNTLQR